MFVDAKMCPEMNSCGNVETKSPLNLIEAVPV